MSLNLPNVFLASIFFFRLLVLLPSFTICSAGLNELILIISFNLVLNASTVHTLGKNVLTFLKNYMKKHCGYEFNSKILFFTPLQRVNVQQ